MMTTKTGKGSNPRKRAKKTPGTPDNARMANSGRNYQPTCSFHRCFAIFFLMIPNLMVHIFQMSCFLRQLNHPWITIWVNLRCLSKIIIMKNTIQSLICSSLKSPWLWAYACLTCNLYRCIILRIQGMRRFHDWSPISGLSFFVWNLLDTNPISYAIILHGSRCWPPTAAWLQLTSTNQ